LKAASAKNFLIISYIRSRKGAPVWILSAKNKIIGLRSSEKGIQRQTVFGIWRKSEDLRELLGDNYALDWFAANEDELADSNLIKKHYSKFLNDPEYFVRFTFEDQIYTLKSEKRNNSNELKFNLSYSEHERCTEEASLNDTLIRWVLKSSELSDSTVK